MLKVTFPSHVDDGSCFSLTRFCLQPYLALLLALYSGTTLDMFEGTEHAGERTQVSPVQGKRLLPVLWL